MQWYWYYLFGRILYKLLTGVKSHEAGRDYEGESMSEDENEDINKDENEDANKDENKDENKKSK